MAAGRIRQLLVEVRGECACREAADHPACEPQRSVSLHRETKRARGNEAVLLAVADQALAGNAAQRSHAVVDEIPRHPDRSRTIFDDRRYARTSRRRRVVEEVTVLEPAQTGARADPEASVAGAEQCPDATRLRLSRRRRPRAELHAIEADESIDCRDPDVPIGGLSEH